MVGTSHDFTVAATGTAPLSYQWQRNGVPLTAETASTLALTAIQTNDAGGYRVVVTNPEGSLTSVVAQLVVRLPSDPLYPEPDAGWTYIYQGSAVAGSQTAALDGSWNHEGDSWIGDGRGAGNGLVGGLSSAAGIATFEDAVFSGSGFNNRRYNFTRSLALDAATTNADSLLNDGVTLTFRARLTPSTDPLIEITNAPNGIINNSDGKGMFGIRQAGDGGLLVGFTLNAAKEDVTATSTFNFGQAGLHMNQLNGNTRTNNVDPGEPGTLNLLPIDSSAFHEFWITIQDNGADPGTHRVSIYTDGSQTPTVFNITAGTGSDGPATNYLALGLGNSTSQRGAVDVDFFGYKTGVVLPAAFNQPIAIASQPVNQFIGAGQIATFNVSVTGTPPYSFQWYRDGSPLSGATNSTYSTAPVTVGDEGALFTVVAGNDFNSVTSSPPAVLSLLGSPIITAQPQSLNVTNGDLATFSVVVSSSVTPSYQWRFNGGNLAGQTSPTLLLPGANAANAGTYDVIASNPSGSVTSAPAILTVVLLDYGDAPDPGYSTLRANNGARHRVMPGIFLGATIDTDLDGQPANDALGDDTAGSDDEDGVSFLTSLIVAQSASVQVVASTNGFLNAWLDWNQNGSWSDAGEQIFTNALLVAGNNSLAFAVPSAAIAGTTYARFRFDSAGGLSFNGPAADGEVEDHTTTIIPVADLRVTQAAAPNPIAAHSDLTSSIIVTNLGPSRAGSITLSNALPANTTFVSANPTQGSCFQIGDSVICQLGAVDSGAAATVTLVLRPTLSGNIANIAVVNSSENDPVPANNSSTANVSVRDAPGIIAQPQSRTITNGSPVTLTVTATGTAPLRYQWFKNATILVGQTNALLTIASALPADAGSYSVSITNLVGMVDSAAATLTVLVPPTITAQPQSLTNLAGTSASFTVTAAGSEPFYYQWRLDTTNLPGQVASSIAIPFVQLTNAGAYSVVVSNAAGVVSSAVATLTVREMDFGDAPEIYPTLLAANGARHRIVPGIRLGATVDFEPEGLADSVAQGDDATGIDDEDGVTFDSAIRTGQIVNLSVEASTNGILNAWLDFNRDGSWSGSDEQVFINRSLSTGLNNLTFIAPVSATPGGSFARFRFNTTGSLSFNGEALNGEVEDYAVTIETVADLSIVRVNQVNPVAVGSNQVYSILISNAGPVTATGVALTDTLPEGMTFISAAATQGGCLHSAGTLSCSLGSLNVGGTATVTLTGRPTAAGVIANEVSVSANQVDVNPADNSVLTEASAMVAPFIASQPQSQSVTNGEGVNFTLAVNATQPRFQWRFNGVNINGATNATFALASAQPVNSGVYSVVVTNEVGQATSAGATLSVLVPVSISAQPQGQTAISGATVILSVGVAGTGPFSYQWMLGGVDLPGKTSSSLVLTGVQSGDAGVYQVRVSNAVGTVLSSGANLTVLVPPIFTVQPQGSTNATGTAVTFTAQVEGTAPLRYQWYFNRTSALANQTNASLSLTGLQSGHSGDYTVVVTNSGGASTSAVAVLAVFNMDFGDAPEAAGYPTTAAFNGARHRVVSGIRLGGFVDFESNGIPSGAATGDDSNGLDDEDGVSFPSQLLLGQVNTATVVASANGFLDAWMDFNGNGSWGDAGERILDSRPVSVGTNLVSFTISPSALTGDRFVRFRFSTAGGLSFDGFAMDGEVEDYRVVIDPSIDLSVGIVDSPDPVNVLGELEFTISATNHGPSASAIVVVTNYFPPSFTFVSATPSQGFCDNLGGSVFCSFDTMPGGTTASAVIRMRPGVMGTFAVRATINSYEFQEPEVNTVDNEAFTACTVIGSPSIFSNPAAIPIADATTPSTPGLALPYPSTILVSGLTSAVYKITATLANITNDFAKDLDVMLVGPDGQSVMLMSDAGASSLNGVTLTFDDDAAVPLPGSGVVAAGTYRPANYGIGADIFPPPAPAVASSASLSTFADSNPNGIWSLYAVDGIVGGLGVIRNGWSLSISTLNPIADLALTAVASSPAVGLGSNLVYSITVTNRGPAIASSVKLTNALPAGVNVLSAVTTQGSCVNQAGLITCTIGDLAEGAGAAATITVIPMVAGVMTNTVAVSGAQLDIVPSNDTVDIVTLASPVTDLVVAQRPSTNLVLLGQELTYFISVTNLGPNTANNAQLTDVLPLTAHFVSASGAQGSCTHDSGIVVCDLGSLLSGGTAQVSIVVQPTLVGSLRNEARIASEAIDFVATNDISSLETVANVAADLSLTIGGSPSPVAVGGVVTYSIQVTNRGPSTASDVLVLDVLPPGLNFVSAFSSRGGCTNAGGAIGCGLAVLDPGSGASVVITAIAGAAGRVTNIVSVESSSIDSLPDNNAAGASIDVELAPKITLSPQSRATTNGLSASFSVAAEGSPTLRYQWQFNFSDIIGATNSTFTLDNATPAAVGSYRVRVSNNVGFAISSGATLVVHVPPVISDIPDQQTTEDTPTVFIPFTVGDFNSSASALTLSGSSSDGTLVPLSGIRFGGSGSNRTVRITPSTNRFGTATITIGVRDPSGLVTSDSFLLSVLSVNDAPSTSVIPDQFMVEDAVLAVPFTVSDVESAPGLFSFQFFSSNPTLVPSSNMILSGTGENRSLAIHPGTNASGSATLQVTVTDPDGASSTASFVVTVTPVNDAPELSGFAPVSIDENTATAPIPFTVSDVESLAEAITVSVASTDSTLITAEGIVVSGLGASRTLTLTPQTNRFGTATISVTAMDPNGGTVVNSFSLTVRQVVFPPMITGQPQGITVTNGAPVSFDVTSTGTLPISYQWKFGGNALPGETNAVLFLTSVGEAQAGGYSVVVSNSAGAVTSVTAVLRVLVEPLITRVVHSGAVTEISFTSIANLSYSVEFKDSLDAPGWGVSGTITGTGNVILFTDSPSAPTSRIYRIRVE